MRHGGCARREGECHGTARVVDDECPPAEKAARSWPAIQQSTHLAVCGRCKRPASPLSTACNRTKPCTPEANVAGVGPRLEQQHATAYHGAPAGRLMSAHPRRSELGWCKCRMPWPGAGPPAPSSRPTRCFCEVYRNTRPLLFRGDRPASHARYWPRWTSCKVRLLTMLIPSNRLPPTTAPPRRKGAEVPSGAALRHRHRLLATVYHSRERGPSHPWAPGGRRFLSLHLPSAYAQNSKRAARYHMRGLRESLH